MFYVAIILAGGSGALLRYLLSRAAVNVGWTALPFGTLIANVIGCFLMGYLSWVLVHRWDAPKELQTVVLTGLLGGFTTFSAFSLEIIALMEQGANGRAMAYLLLSVMLCLSMCFVGLLAAKHT